MKKLERIFLLFLILGMIVFLIWLFTHKAAPKSQHEAKVQPEVPEVSACDSILWQHIYHPKRLQIIENCKTVTGVLQLTRKERDGDLHMLVKLDPGFESLLNDQNITRQRGDLVIEPVCVGRVTQADAMDVCTNYASTIVIPPIGTRVEITGSFVFDTEHGWNEIHPVTSIKVLH